MRLCKDKQYFITDALKETGCISFPSEIAWSEQSYWPNTAQWLRTDFLKSFAYFMQ